MTRIRTVTLLCCVSLAGWSVSQNAIAQDQAKAGAAKPASKAGEFEEIIVTAQKRQENAQDIPITLAVVSDEQLSQQNIVTATDLVQAVPSLTVTNFGVFQVRS